jgi:hypothetical protein
VIGQFDPQLTLPTDPTEKIRVAGPLRDMDPKDTSAKVLFLIVQGEGKDALTVQGEGKWTRGSSQGDKPWIGRVNREGTKVGGKTGRLKKGKARGIGLAIVVKDGSLTANGEFVPPGIEALTWCADFRFV